ncbi:MAG: hypothetical protein PHW77_09325, partial [Eubacteriales bacterium]|nr:hypothetical protein [Eubacteriales bacterium]
MKIKLISLMLTLALVVIFAASCSETGDDNSKEQSAASEQSDISDNASANASSTETSEEDDFYDGLPNISFNGRDFTILQRTEYKYEYTNDDLVSEKVKTLISERNRTVEQRFGVKIKTIEQNGTWGVHEDFMTYIRNSINGNTADYDIISGYAAIMPTLVSDGYFINWYELDEYINFEKSWWSQDFISEMTLNDRLYLLSGDISLTFWESMQCIFFNKTIAASYNLNNLYDMVRQNEWTFDAMLQIIKDTYNENSDPSSQIYGYATALTVQIDVYQDAFNIPVTTKDSEGKPSFSINQPKTYTALDKNMSLLLTARIPRFARTKAVRIIQRNSSVRAGLCLLRSGSAPA